MCPVCKQHKDFLFTEPTDSREKNVKNINYSGNYVIDIKKNKVTFIMLVDSNHRFFFKTYLEKQRKNNFFAYSDRLKKSG